MSRDIGGRLAVRFISYMIYPIFHVVLLNGRVDSAVVSDAFCPSSNPGHVTCFSLSKNEIFESNSSENRDRKRIKADNRDDFTKNERSEDTKLVA